MAIVLTGFGVQSPLGCSFPESMETLRNGRPCVEDIQNYDTEGYEIRAAGEVRCGGEVVKTPREIDRKIFFLDRALRELSLNTGFSRRYGPNEVMLNIGAGVDYFDAAAFTDQVAFHHKTARQIREVARKWHLEAGTHIFASACTASAHAIGFSCRLLRRGLATVVVSGGIESMISHVNYLGFYLLGALSRSDDPAPYKCKPCDLRSTGTILGEGAVVMLLERSEKVSDPASILAEIAGYGCTMDAYAVTDPDPSGVPAAEAVRQALDDAGIDPEQIDCVHLHGTGTSKCAPAEYNTLRLVFGEKRASEIPVYSMKGQVGHLIAACTAIEMLGVVYSLEHQVVLPTINFCEPDPRAPLNVVKDRPLSMPIRHVLKLNSAFGGHNTALIIKKWGK